MPKEVAIGHKGRIDLVLSKAEFDELLAERLREEGESPIPPPVLHQLALVSDMPATEYAMQHSMLAALRVASRNDEDLVHGSPESASFSRNLGMLTQRSGAYFCVDCVREDLAKDTHFSWFRRAHQLLGVDWCPTHRFPLLRVTAPNPWKALPQQWLESGDFESLNPCCNALVEPSFLGRYVDIASALLERSRPFETRVIGEAISKRAKLLGLRGVIYGVRPLLSDYVRSVAPAKWLGEHLSELHKNHEGTFFTAVDLLVSSRTVASAGYTYPLALAALFDNAEDAIRHLGMKRALAAAGRRPKFEAQPVGAEPSRMESSRSEPTRQDATPALV
jgi:hypothetical protein